MKHIASFFVALLIIMASLFSFAPSASADVQDFTISSFNADYLLDKNADGVSTLKVTETIVVEFPQFNQNKGIVRSIPAIYKTFSLDFKLESITRNGITEPLYAQQNQGGYHILSLGTSDYVLGAQTYIISYTLKNVIADIGDYQEIYWNVNGTDWKQPIQQVTAKVRLGGSIKDSYSGEALCFQGSFGSTDACTIGGVDDTVTFQSTRPMQAGGTTTFVMKFAPKTFAVSTKTLLHYLPIIFAGLVTVALAMTIYRYNRYGRNHPGRGTIVPQYTPPKDTAVLTAAIVKKVGSKIVAAQIIDLAIRNYVKIIDHKDEGKKGEFSIEIIGSGLYGVEQSFLRQLIPGLVVGSKYRFSKKPDAASMKVGEALRLYITNFLRPVAGNELRRKPSELQWIALPFAVLFSAGLVIFFLDIYLYDPLVSLIAGGILIVYGIIALTAANARPLTEKGRELYDYLKGLEKYIKMAEKDRIAVLQSVEGALRSDGIVSLYEKVLPYAILFGHEKSWTRVLAIHYEEENITSRSWMNGASIATISRNVQSFGSTTHGFSGSGSSRSGFSGGGGAGGGGGGGGGGGR